MKRYQFPCGCSWPLLQEGEPPLLDFDPEEIPESCPATWELLGKGLTKGVFQLESPLGRQWTKKLKPESAEHLAALASILRPGCLKALDQDGVSMTQHYCRRKNGEEEIKGYHPAIDAILASTYNVLAFQEQSMSIAQVVAGFDLQQADSLRKSIGKKDTSEMAKCRLMFLAGTREAGILTEDQAQEVFGWIQESQRYQFNRCVSGDTIIRKVCPGKYLKAEGYTVREMYLIRNNLSYAKLTGHEQLRRKWRRLGYYGKGLSRGEDGRIRPNVIRAIHPSSILPVYQILLANGSSIRVTANHKFPTPEGVKTVSTLTLSDCLYVCGAYEPTDFGPITRYSNLTREDIKQRNRETVNSAFGKKNWSYTNGSYTECKNNNLLIPRRCEHCGATDRTARLELHHRDANRADSGLNNLIRLCSSCHKKAQYQLGRRKRGEKGYPSLVIPIVSIEETGWTDTYDVTMDAPHHTFVVGSGILTCNSHAMCYGLTGYQSAYIKAHFPLAFFTGWLANAKHKRSGDGPQQEVYELVNDTKLFDITVEPPDFRLLSGDFQTDGQAVHFGLANIKGLGGAQVDKIQKSVILVEEMLAKPVATWTWTEFLFYFADRVSSTAVERLIEVGALGSRRQLLAAEYLAWRTLTDKEKQWVREVEQKSKPFDNLMEALRAVAHTKKEGGGCASTKRVGAIRSQVYLLEHPPSPVVDTPHWIATREEELLGVPLTCTRIDSCDISQVNTTCKEIRAGRRGFLMLGVTVEEVREVKTRKGKNPGSRMGRLVVSDGTCALEAVVFPDVWKEFRHVLTEGNTVILQGERETRNKDYDSFIVKKVWQALNQKSEGQDS